MKWLLSKLLCHCHDQTRLKANGAAKEVLKKRGSEAEAEMDNVNGNCNDANKTEPSGSEKESNIVHDDINFANKKARVNKLFSAPSYSIQIRDVAPMR